VHRHGANDGKHMTAEPTNEERFMTLTTRIKRLFPSREDAFAYLTLRGFLFMPAGWENGRWAADLDFDGHQFVVTAWLRAPKQVAA
jgi:hypothetical protein